MPAQGDPGAGVAPLVALLADDTSLAAGQQITLTFTVTSQAPLTQTHAGFNIRSSQPGTFATGGAFATGTRTIMHATNGTLEGTHSAPKANTGTFAVFSVVWTPAVTTSGMVTFTAWGNSVNNNAPTDPGNGNTGDRGAVTTLDVTVAACTPTNWYRDADGDNFGNPAVTSTSCAQPGGFVANNTDCNDAVATTFPGATETCNGVDDDCDATADDGLATTTFYRDMDNDSYGAQASGTKMSCSLAQAGAGFVASNTDCNDNAAAVNPGATETCNMVDDNCTGGTDEGVTMTFYPDVDGDGFGAGTAVMACSAPTGHVTNNTDCDDTAAGVKPGATEVCNGRDDNCAGGVDEGLGMLTCGTDPCVTMVAACVNGAPQTCTPVCPPDAGVDAAPDTGPEAGPEPGPEPAAEPQRDGPAPDMAPVPDAPPPSDAKLDGLTVDMAASGDAGADRPLDSGTTTPDAGTTTDARTDTRDGATDGRRAAGGDGCDCRLGGDRGQDATGGALSVLVGLVLAGVIHRRRRRR